MFLASYNGGILYGVWMDATGELDEIQEQVNVMLKERRRWDTHDYEDCGGCVRANIQV